MSTENMELWSRHNVTDPAYTKVVEFGRKFTAINPHYQLAEATKEWGPYGKTWGLRDITFQTIQTQQIDKKSKVAYTATNIILSATFFYPCGEFQIIVDDEFVAGQDTFKKLTTNARSKALSWLGFNADVFFGDFDDADYVRDVKIRFGDMESLRKRVLGVVKTSKTAAELDKHEARVKEMVADDTISPELGNELLGEIKFKRSTIK